jgi:hypothetical protein
MYLDKEYEMQKLIINVNAAKDISNTKYTQAIERNGKSMCREEWQKRYRDEASGISMLLLYAKRKKNILKM